MNRHVARLWVTGALLAGMLSACVPAPLRPQPNAQVQLQTRLVPAPVEAPTGESSLYREPGPTVLQIRSDRPVFVTSVVVPQSGGARVIPVGQVAAGTPTSLALPGTLGFTQVFTVSSLTPLDLEAATGAQSLSEVARVVAWGTASLPAGSYTVETTVYRVVRFGTLEIRASRPGAEVRVGGRRVGITPLILRDVPEGQVTVEVTDSGQGFEAVTQTVNVQANAITQVTATLRPETGTLRAESALPASVLVNGRHVGTTPLRVKVRPGVVNVNVVPLQPGARAETLLIRVMAHEETVIFCPITAGDWHCGVR